ncbi:MAG: hypothetical protein RLZZ196_2481 [Bacteroidota bacterium]|jgi:hypothetical protein
MAKIKQKATSAKDIIAITADMGDTLREQWEQNKDLKVAQTALLAYGKCIAQQKVQLIHKKLTGEPISIPFLQ